MIRYTGDSYSQICSRGYVFNKIFQYFNKKRTISLNGPLKFVYLLDVLSLSFCLWTYMRVPYITAEKAEPILQRSLSRRWKTEWLNSQWLIIGLTLFHKGSFYIWCWPSEWCWLWWLRLFVKLGTFGLALITAGVIWRIKKQAGWNKGNLGTAKFEFLMQGLICLGPYNEGLRGVYIGHRTFRGSF